MYGNKLSKVSLLLVLTLCLFMAGTLVINPVFADAQRVVNGGFETGDLTGWTVQEPPLWEGGVSKAYAHSGIYSLFLAQVDSIYQAFNPPVSTTGDLSLWAMSTGDETYPLAVTITYSDGTSNSTGVTPLGGYHVWVHYTLPVDHTKLVSKISFFTWEMMFPGYYVDDVSLMGPSAGYSATIWSWDYISGWQSSPITMDGVATGFSTPHTFTGLTGTHTFTVPSTDSAGHPFSDWNTNWTDRTITVGSAGTYTARYRAGYSATIWSWCALDAWLALPITMDGVATGFSTPHIFSGLIGTHTFTVPSTDPNGHPFYQWSTGSTSTTLTTTSAGVYTARYEPKPTVTSFAISPNPFSPNGDALKDNTTIKVAFDAVTKWNLQIRNSSGTTLRTWTGTGSSLSIVWDGKNSTGFKVPDGTYKVRLSGKDLLGIAFTTKWATVTVDTKRPTVTGVSVYPTSFKPTNAQTTRINYTLSDGCYVTIKIYNSTGTLKKTLLNNVLQASRLHSVVWNGKDNSNLTVPSGTYTIKIYVIDKAGNKATSYPITKTVTVT
jgi:flagellar hook assembly protein FlgD